MRILSLLLLLALAASPIHAQTPGVAEAAAASQQIERAISALQKATKARSRVKALGRAVRAYENGLAVMRDGLRLASARKIEIEAEWQSRRAELSELLGVLQQIERSPAPLLMAHPGGPVGAARAAHVMAEMTPALQTKTEALRAELTELKQLAKVQALAESHMRQGLSDLQTARSDLTEALSRRRKLPTRIGADKSKLTELAQNAKSLRQFATALGALKTTKADAPMAGFQTGRGTLIPPVSGKLLRGYKQPDAGGLARPGLILSAPPLSIVTAPWGATLRYVGNLLDYGTVAILEPRPGYLMVLAGLGEVFVDEGAVIARGDPIGLLKGDQPGADEFLIELTSGKSFIRNESLYIELREDGIPVDPTPWFVLDLDEKGSR